MPDGEGMRERVLALMGAAGYRPRNKGELARGLELHPDDRAGLRAELAKLEREGVIVRGKKGRYQLRARDQQLLIGTIRMHPKGNGWFYPDPRDEANRDCGIDLEKFRRFYIPASKTSVALDGDRVAVRAERVGPPKWWKHAKHKQAALEMPGAEEQASGRVERIIERRSGVVIGVFIEKGKFRYVQPDDPTMPASIDLVGDIIAKSGQKVAVELLAWDSRQVTPQGRIRTVLGWPGDPGVDILSIVHRHGLRLEFPPEVVDGAREVPSEIADEELARREDWREEGIVTIDPEDAKDFDDAISVEKTEGGWRLAVHIADVAHYVKPGTPLDKEAEERGNSTYLVDRVLPMLPPELSNGICSLRPGEDRLTCAAVIEFGSDGAMRKARFAKAVIRSRRRFTYEEAQEILVATDDSATGGEATDPLSAMLREAWNLASLLRRRRFAHGALDLDFAEVRVVLDEHGRPTGYRREEYNESHQLIEEFMLAANEAVARAVKNAQRPGIYRVHEDPDLDKLFEFAELARTYGYAPGDLTNKKHIQTLLDAVRGKPEEHAIKIGLLKSLKRAHYLDEPQGHYGLSKTDYCHFTSPIRRYADLIMHRAIEPLLDNPPETTDRLPRKKHCAEISDHISTTERTSASAEDESRRLKMLEWLQLSAREPEPPVFEAVVTDVRRIGLLVEAVEILQRGLIKRSGFPRGDWRFEGHRMCYRTMQGEELGLGQVLRVRVEHVDIEKQFVDFRIVDGTGGDG
jgi:ribonuclease R